MHRRPTTKDLGRIGAPLGRVSTGIGLIMMVPAMLALLGREWNALTGLLVGAALAVLLGEVTYRRLRSRGRISWSEGMVVAAGAWMLAAALGAVPLHLSGQTSTYLDALVDAMSGLTTTGLSLVQDLDHLPRSLVLWRHLLQLIGGLATIVVALTLFTAASSKAGTLFLFAERERVAPNPARVARDVLTTAAVYAVVGVSALTVALIVAGVPVQRVSFHAITLFLSAFMTAGFAPQSTSVAYYHSAGVEAILMILMLAGAIAFPLHMALWRGQWRELARNLQSRALAVTGVMLLVTVLVGLARAGAYTDVGPLLRRGLFAVVSAHTTTGLTLTSPRLYATDWGLIAPAGLVAAMALGGMHTSTGGGVKAMRVGGMVKGIVREIRRVLLPDSALVVETFHDRGRRRALTDVHVRSIGSILLLYLATFLVGALAILYAAETFDLTEALFESVSATSNAGLSVGILRPTSPVLLKVIILFQMWLGRLEFMAVFALFGLVVRAIRRGAFRSTAREVTSP